MEKPLDLSWVEFVHIPPRERTGQERLLLVMHGLGDSLEGYRMIPDILKIPGLHYVLVNAPDRYFTGYSWFDFYGGDPKKGIIRSRNLLFAVLDDLAEQGWPPEKVGILGFSQGCLMALDVACRYPKRLGAVVGISGFVGLLEEFPEKLSSAAKTQKILVTHGTMDPLLPLAQTQSQVRALQGMGLSIEWKAYEKEHTIEPYEEVRDIRSFLMRTLMKG
jgi:phospholipase/carboxylesterase